MTTEKLNIFDLPVLPSADIFPMMPDDELHELAADIKENGLREPVVISERDGVAILVDGRNRRAACRIAGVEPSIRKLNGEDPDAYVLSANVHRRHMTKGQRAMAVAMIYPEGEQGKRSTSLKINEVSGGYIRQARTVLSYSHPVAESVLAGIKPLDIAYKEAQAAKQKQMGDEAAMQRLRSEAPDLADLAIEDRMTLSEAIAANTQRQSERAQRIREAREASSRLWRDVSNCLGCIAHGQELGEEYVIPDEERDFAEQLVRRLAALIGREVR